MTAFFDVLKMSRASKTLEPVFFDLINLIGTPMWRFVENLISNDAYMEGKCYYRFHKGKFRLRRSHHQAFGNLAGPAG